MLWDLFIEHLSALGLFRGWFTGSGTKERQIEEFGSVVLIDAKLLRPCIVTNGLPDTNVERALYNTTHVVVPQSRRRAQFPQGTAAATRRPAFYALLAPECHNNTPRRGNSVVASWISFPMHNSGQKYGDLSGLKVLDKEAAFGWECRRHHR